MALVAWLPLLVLAVGPHVLGLLGDVTTLRADLPGGVPEPPEMVSLLTFLLLDAPVALLAWGSLVMGVGCRAALALDRCGRGR